MDTGGRPKFNRHVVAERRLKIEQMFALMMEEREIARHIRREYGISRVMVGKDMVIVARRMQSDAAKVPIETRRIRMRQTLNTLYRKCIKDGDHKSAVVVLDRLARIDGLYEPVRVSVTHGVRELTVAELEALPMEARDRLRGVIDVIEANTPPPERLTNGDGDPIH